ncbi:MAG: glycosyltransferase family 2 protein [Prevotella sp.]|nr:glycosyltransferase family 2 protein [Prevotella sp.]
MKTQYVNYEKPLVSIVMATYNGERYLKEQLDSILNQSVQNFELIICDDCSTDRTLDILNEYSERDKRISIFPNNINIGVKRNFERGISLSNCDLIAFSDQDDIWRHDHIELLMNTIGDKMMACGNSDMIYEDGTPMGMTLSYQDAFDYIPKNDLYKAMTIILFRNPFQGASMMIRKELFIQAGPVPENVGFHDEWLAAYASFYGGINYIKESLLKYRRLSSSVTGIKNKRRNKILAWRNHHFYEDRIYIINAILERNKKLSQEQIQYLCLWKKMYWRNNKVKGKILNALYKIKYYKYIYSCDFIHWI